MENKYSKPGYDGRLKYYEHLKDYWDRLADATFQDDYIMKYKAARGYFSRTMSFIREKERGSILDLFNKVKNSIKVLNEVSKSNQLTIIFRVEEILQDIEDKLFSATKDMLVSTKDDDDEQEYDMKAFMGESD